MYSVVCTTAVLHRAYLSPQVWYCNEKKQVDKGKIPPTFQMLSEIGEVAGALLDPKVRRHRCRHHTGVFVYLCIAH